MDEEGVCVWGWACCSGAGWCSSKFIRSKSFDGAGSAFYMIGGTGANGATLAFGEFKNPANKSS